MNFLGHIYLTPTDDHELLVGNFIADSVKGNPEFQLPGRVAKGVRLHRAIDDFTDKHPLVKQGVERFRATQGGYATVVIDVVYDHVLARNWEQFHHEELQGYTQRVYRQLDELSELFPKPVEQYFPYMRQQNWLYNYQFEWGFRKSLEGLDRRSSNPTEMYKAVEVFQNHRSDFETEFEAFISDAKRMVSAQFSG